MLASLACVRQSCSAYQTLPAGWGTACTCWRLWGALWANCWGQALSPLHSWNVWLPLLWLSTSSQLRCACNVASTYILAYLPCFGCAAQLLQMAMYHSAFTMGQHLCTFLVGVQFCDRACCTPSMLRSTSVQEGHQLASMHLLSNCKPWPSGFGTWLQKPTTAHMSSLLVDRMMLSPNLCLMTSGGWHQCCTSVM